MGGEEFMNKSYEISGIYKCSTSGCNNEVVHVKNEVFNSCGVCNNNNWILVRETKIGVLVEMNKMQSYLEWTKNMMYLDTIADRAKKRSIKRGEVYRCKLGVGVGSEEGKERPCVILQANVGNAKSSNTIVAPITHTSSTLPIVVPISDKLDSDGNIILDGNVLLGNIVTVSKARLGDYICKLSSNEILKIDEAIATSIDIKRHYDTLMRKYEDKLEYIKKLKQKNEEYKGDVDILNSIKALLNEEDSNELIKKIKNILSENMDKH